MLDISTAEIVSTKGHYEVYQEGKFVCSADTYAEAISEINDYFKGDNNYET